MDLARRQTRLAFALAFAGWALIVVSLVVGFMQPRWYLWNDWRETSFRVAFWVVLILVPACAVGSLVIGRRARRAPSPDEGPWARRAFILGVCVLILCGFAILGLLGFLVAIGPT